MQQVAHQHQHQPGDRRRERARAVPARKKRADPTRTSAAEAPATVLTDEQVVTGLEHLIDKAQRGDVEAWRTLQSVLEPIPHWETRHEPPAALARRMLLDTVIGSNLLMQAAWERRVQALAVELAGTTPSPLERILCERVATCWLDTSLADLAYAAHLNDAENSLTAGEYYSRQRDHAHQRYLAACLALAKVQRLRADAQSGFGGYVASAGTGEAVDDRGSSAGLDNRLGDAQLQDDDQRARPRSHEAGVAGSDWREGA